MKLRILAPFALCLLFLAAGPAFADSVLVNDYPINGQNDGFTINFGFSVSDQFVLSSSSTITGVNFGAWLLSGDTLDSVTWTISSGDLGTGTVYGTATASTGLDTSVTPFTNGSSFDVESATFSISSLDLSAGTYFLTLDDAVTAEGNPAFWDMNNVPDVGYESSWGSDAANCNAGQDLNNQGGSYTGNCANAFQILGSSTITSTAAPEPNTSALLGVGMFVLGSWMFALGCFRKRLRQSLVS